MICRLVFDTGMLVYALVLREEVMRAEARARGRAGARGGRAVYT